MARLNFIWNMSRLNKRFISISVDTFFIFTSFYAAYWTRIGHIKPLDDVLTKYVVFGTLLVTIFSFTKLGLYRAVLRYLTFHALAVVSLGTVISAASISVLAFYFDAPVPGSVQSSMVPFCVFCVAVPDSLFGVLVSQSTGKGKKSVISIGLVPRVDQLALALRSSETLKVVGFIDEDNTLYNTIIMGLKVKGIRRAESLIEKHSVSQILLAVPSASRSTSSRDS